MRCLNVSLSNFIIPLFLIIVFLYSTFKKTDAYDAFIEGCNDGIKQSFSILPFLLSMYVAVKVLDSSGIIEDIIKLKSIPSELFIQGIFRPVSSNASLSYMIDIFEVYGVDSPEGVVSSILQGCTDTTLYVITLYFGSIGVKKYRYSVFIGLLSDLLCFVICVLMYFFIF